MDLIEGELYHQGFVPRHPEITVTILWQAEAPTVHPSELVCWMATIDREYQLSGFAQVTACGHLTLALDAPSIREAERRQAR